MVQCSECSQKFADKENDAKCRCSCHSPLPSPLPRLPYVIGDAELRMRGLLEYSG